MVDRKPIDRTGEIARILKKLRIWGGSSLNLTGGDLDNDRYQASVVGEEAVGGDNPTPDQNVTEQLLHSMGVDSVDGELVYTKEKLERRDRERWELDPLSAEDYQEHNK